MADDTEGLSALGSLDAPTASPESPESLLSPHTVPGVRPADPRRLMHNDLAYGVIRDFRRVLAELQGLGVEPSVRAGLRSDDGASRMQEHRTHERELGSAFGELCAPSCHPLPSILETIGREGSLYAPGVKPDASDTRPFSASGGSGLEYRPGMSADPSSADTTQHSLDGFSHPEPFLPRTKRFGLLATKPLDIYDAVSSTPAHHSTAFSAGGLEAPTSAAPPRVARERASPSRDTPPDGRGAVALLLAHAAAAEAHAVQLREIADQLDGIARCRRHLANVTAGRRGSGGRLSESRLPPAQGGPQWCEPRPPR